jgi:hypothetical protein
VGKRIQGVTALPLLIALVTAIVLLAAHLPLDRVPDLAAMPLPMILFIAFSGIVLAFLAFAENSRRL